MKSAGFSQAKALRQQKKTEKVESAYCDKLPQQSYWNYQTKREKKMIIPLRRRYVILRPTYVS